MKTGEDARWTDLVDRSGVTDGARLREIAVRAVRLPHAPEDVILCPVDDADARLAHMRSKAPATRAIQAERVFMARTMSRDAVTAAALLVRAVVSNWTAMRGHNAVYDEHERRAVALAEAHLRACGITHGDDIKSAQRQIPRTHIQPPVAHECPVDVVRKAIGQMARQIGNRHVILLGDGPMAD